MSIQKSLGVLFYSGLLIGGLVFSWQSISDYIKGNTSYLVTQELITLDDFPTLVVCIPKLLRDTDGKKREYKYGTDLFMNGSVNEESVPLQENSWVKTLSLEVHLSEMHQRWTDRKQCYKISSRWINKVELKNFKFGLGLQCGNVTEPPCEFEMLFEILV